MTPVSSISIKNLTAFVAADLELGAHLNLFVGENGSGKTHLLKLAYSVLATSAAENMKPANGAPTKAALQGRLADKLVGVFRPETLGRLARRRPGRERCEIEIKFSGGKEDLAFAFATNSKTDVTIKSLPTGWVESAPAYIPTRELLSIYPNFVPLYESRYLEFEESWRDTCVLLGALLVKGPKEKHIAELLKPLEQVMGGRIELDKNGRFYLNNQEGRFEIPLVAEGLRKLGMIARLVATGALFENGYLFWDEPEANLNPRLIKRVALTILDLCKRGIQVFIATHSLFLMREVQILLCDSRWQGLDCRYFGLHRTDDGIGVQQGKTMDDIGDIAALDEELQQSDRYVETI